MPAVNITTNATTVIRSDAPARLDRVIINKAGASANTLKLYDGVDTTGLLLGTIDTTVVRGLEFGLNLERGLTVVTATGTAGDVTVIFDEVN
jgi:hypothetical protein